LVLLVTGIIEFSGWFFISLSQTSACDVCNQPTDVASVRSMSFS
jgi:hypothetical protein